ncbi:hypothetical protein HDU81_001571 [Chytriomyces hyalinus]|nr:hypothetical protein HDU81_001571 [Chytriomyces hyalinus]
MEPTERLIPTSRRADGSLRKEIRVRNGFIPQEDVGKYQTARTSLTKASASVVPGATPKPASKPSLDAAKASKNVKTASGAVSAKEAARIRAREEAKDRTHRPVASANEPTQPIPDSLETLEKKVKNLRKKHRTIIELESKDIAMLQPDQVEKLKGKAHVEAQIQETEEMIATMRI